MPILCYIVVKIHDTRDNEKILRETTVKRKIPYKEMIIKQQKGGENIFFRVLKEENSHLQILC